MPGSLDSRGIYRHAEDDAASTFSGMLDLLADSVSNKVASMTTTTNTNKTLSDNADTALDTRLDAIETDTGWVNLTTTGVTSVICQYRKVDRIVYFRLEAYNVTSGTLCTIPVGYRPTSRFEALAMRAASAPNLTSVAAAYFQTSGVVELAMAAGTTITGTPGYTINTSWPI